MNLREVGGLMRRMGIASAGYKSVDRLCRTAGLGEVTQSQWFTLLAESKNSADIKVDCVTDQFGQVSRVLCPI